MSTEPIDQARPTHHAAAPAARRTSDTVMLSTFCGCDAQGQFLVMQDGQTEPVVALSTIALLPQDAGCQVVLAPQQAPGAPPVILGRLQTAASSQAATLRLDGERLVLRAERDIELRCGEASIVLTRAGKILIKGEYVLSRAKGANRIKGAYVDIN